MRGSVQTENGSNVIEMFLHCSLGHSTFDLNCPYIRSTMID